MSVYVSSILLPFAKEPETSSVDAILNKKIDLKDLLYIAVFPYDDPTFSRIFEINWQYPLVVEV